MLKIISATAMTIFSLFAAFMGTMAWFMSVRNVDNTADQLQVSASNRKFSRMTLHKYIETADGQYKFEQTPSGTFSYNWGSETTGYNRDTAHYEGDSLSAFMGEYSLMYPSHPFLALIEYSELVVTDATENSIIITANTERNFIGAQNDDGSFKEELTTTNNPLSSIIKFNTTSYANLNNNKTGTTSYDFNIPNSWDHFVNITKDNKDNLVFDEEDGGWENSKTLISVTDGTSIQYIAIIFNYYEEALEYIYNIYLGSPVLEQESVPFQCDCAMVI